jgi:hypothetical protein
MKILKRKNEKEEEEGEEELPTTQS